MKLLPFLALSCFLTLGTTSFSSTSTVDTNTLSESTDSAIMASTSKPANDTARRGSGRREVLAQTSVVQVVL